MSGASKRDDAIAKLAEDAVNNLSGGEDLSIVVVYHAKQ